ncbi:17806_t:CDS:10 [Acaulospora morrowiae]|uniref:17806_t:CDS:1 n=1 Tax=Acaulospora morrowiae TaxID=94023 RepID=A0A9N9F3A7_9GLOM|nr:17806_t:CDS:10 [Acaulospora morrowiae]
MFNAFEGSGFNYFSQTLVHNWDSLDYHIFWKRTISATLNKATVSRVFSDQIEWLIANGTESGQEKAKYLKNQFKGPVGLRLLHGTPAAILATTLQYIDSQKGGRIYLFWKEEMHAKKLNNIEKDASIKIHNLQAQHHISVANRILTRGNDTLETIPLNEARMFVVKQSSLCLLNVKQIRDDNVDDTYSKESISKKVDENTVHENKRKRVEDEVDYDGLSLLFDELSENNLVDSIDERILEEENVLPQARGNSDSKEQQKNIEGILDLTKESLYDCKQLTEKDIMQISQDFADKISWKTMPPERNIREYFDSNCEKKIDDNHGIGKLDVNVKFIKSGVYSFQGMMTEEELKMSSTFPLFRGVFTSNNIKNAWGEIQALPTNYARNEKGNPFKKARIGRRVDMKSTLIKTSNKFEIIYGEVSGGLGPLGIPTACRKKRYLDKVKLMIIMRDSINKLLKECKHISFEKRTNLIVYGWLQIGLELNFYAMDWSGAGIYRFGLIDQCRLPSDEDEFGILEDAYCILKLLENKSLEIEKVVKKLFLENTKGKRRRIATETEAELNENRSPVR